MSAPPTLGQVVDVLDELYDPATAADWDAVGLVCGDPDAPVRRVMFAVDPVAEVAQEAVSWGADLLVTHHPLFLHGVHGVAATTPKGRLLHRLVTNGVALHVAHTNADVAAPGVSDALADALGLVDLQPLEPIPDGPLDKVVVFAPTADASRLVDALSEAGAGRLGAYSRCAFTSEGTGTFRPEPGADPAIGTVGAVETVPETRVEMVLRRSLRADVVAALRAAHPYEEPAFDVVEMASVDGRRGLGRVGRLAQPEPLRAFARRAAAALPPTAWGVRATGDPERRVQTVAVSGGAGDGLLGAATRAGADVFLTADLRHHPASEHVEGGNGARPPALLDAAHWATEWPWLGVASRDVLAALQARGTTVETHVSRICTDPWSLHVPTTGHSDEGDTR